MDVVGVIDRPVDGRGIQQRRWPASGERLLP
jgi:hypothetical protein